MVDMNFIRRLGIPLLSASRQKRRKRKRKSVRNTNREQVRRQQLLRCVPDVWDAKTILNIGANKNRFFFQEDMKKSGALVDVLEVDSMRCGWLREQKWINRVIRANVVNANEALLRNYDLVFWSHGPALLEMKYIEPTLEALWKFTSKLLVVMTPWGRYYYATTSKLSPIDWNRTALYPDFFLKAGFEVDAVGKPDTGTSGHILAWRRR